MIFPREGLVEESSDLVVLELLFHHH
jgi:hypothetical protein